MNLIRRLAEVYPDWRDHFRDPVDAAIDIGLIDPDDSDPEYTELDFDDPAANISRLNEAYEEYAALMGSYDSE